VKVEVEGGIYRRAEIRETGTVKEEALLVREKNYMVVKGGLRRFN